MQLDLPPTVFLMDPIHQGLNGQSIKGETRFTDQPSLNNHRKLTGRHAIHHHRNLGDGSLDVIPFLSNANALLTVLGLTPKLGAANSTSEASMWPGCAACKSSFRRFSNISKYRFSRLPRPRIPRIPPNSTDSTNRRSLKLCCHADLHLPLESILHLLTTLM